MTWVSPIFSSRGWDEYICWQATDKRMLKRINDLIKDIQRSPYQGIGKPEPLKHELAGTWSRRISAQHRIVYRLADGQLQIVSCRSHY